MPFKAFIMEERIDVKETYSYTSYAWEKGDEHIIKALYLFMVSNSSLMISNELQSSMLVACLLVYRSGYLKGLGLVLLI